MMTSSHGKAAVKIRMQYGKRITDSRFCKPPKGIRKTSFRAVASAVRESAVCLHQGRNEIRCHQGQETSFGAPMFEPEFFLKQICCWRKCLWHC